MGVGQQRQLELSANWTFAVPNGIGVAAVVNVPTTSQLTVTLDEAVTLGSLLLGNSASSSVGYTISGSGSNTLTLNNSGSGATIAVSGGSHQINAPVLLSDNLLVTSSGANPWTLSFGSANNITDNGAGFSLTMSGSGGMLVLGGTNSYTGGTNVSAGTLVATSIYALPIGSRLTISAAGTVNLGSNALITDEPNSGMTGGALFATYHDVGYSGTGTFTQTGGTNTLSNGLYIGCNPGDSGTYNLGGGQVSAQYEYIGLSGSGSFSQSGGTHVAGNLVLGDNAGSLGDYNLNGGLLNVAALSAGAGSVAFNFSGGTLQASSSFSVNVPIALSLAGSNGVFDTQGYTLTLAAPLSGPGGLQKVGSGTLVLTASNTYTGTTLVSAGTLDVTGMLSGGSVQVASGATLGFSGPIDSTLLLAGGVVATGSGTISSAHSPAAAGPSPTTRPAP